MNLRILSPAEKKRLLTQLNEQFGISTLKGIFIETGKEKIRYLSGSLSPQELRELAPLLNLELAGLYLCKREHEKELRLGFDATQLLASQINKNIIEITEAQAHEWLRGHNLDIKARKGIVLIHHGPDFFGCGISTGERILNHVPKERRIKK